MIDQDDRYLEAGSESAAAEQVIRANQRQTALFIFCFFGCYLWLGVCLDVYFHRAYHPQVTFAAGLFKLLHFVWFPAVTGMLLLGLVSLFMLIGFFHEQIVVMGTAAYRIDPNRVRSLEERKLYHIAEEMKIAAALHFMPKIYLIEAPYMNAFVSGYSERSAIIVLTRGLLDKLTWQETRAVLAHQLMHIHQQDLPVTLFATVLSNLPLILLDSVLFPYFLARHQYQLREGVRWSLSRLTVRQCSSAFSFYWMFFLKKKRCYAVDAAASQLLQADRDLLAKALIKIHADHNQFARRYEQFYQARPHEQLRRAAYFYDPCEVGIELLPSLTNLFSTHPYLEDRLSALAYQRSSLW